MNDAAAQGAKLLFNERARRTNFHNLDDIYYPDGEASAYAIQDGLLNLLKDNGASGHAGYKIALSVPVMQELLGADRPCMGVLHTNSIWTSPHTIRVDDHMHLGLECEIAVRVGADLSPKDAPFTRKEIVDVVTACHVSFEAIDDRNADYSDSEYCSLIADNCWNAGVILGSEFDNWRSLDFTATRGTLMVNGEEVGHGLLSDAMGHPFEAVAWLANLMAERGRTVERNSIIMTGSIVPTVFGSPGDEIKYMVEGVGEAVATFV